MKIPLHYLQSVKNYLWGTEDWVVTTLETAEETLAPTFRSLPKFVELPTLAPPPARSWGDVDANGVAIYVIAAVVVVWILLVVLLYFKWILLADMDEHVVLLKNDKVSRVCTGQVIFCVFGERAAPVRHFHSLSTTVNCVISMQDAACFTFICTIEYDILSPQTFFARGESMAQSMQRLDAELSDRLKVVFDGETPETLWKSTVYASAKEAFTTKYQAALGVDGDVRVRRLEYMIQE